LNEVVLQPIQNVVEICKQIIILTYLLIELALLEEPPIVQPLKNFPAFYGTRRFNTVFTRALHWSLS
jgi:hypothetical protein